MGISCGAKVARFVLVVFNIFFFLFGAIILGIGIWIVTDKTSLFNLAKSALSVESGDAVQSYMMKPSLVETGAYVLIGIGSFNFVVGFCGCCGALRESRCLLGLYALFVLLILIIEIAGAVLAGVYQKKLEGQLESGLAKNLNESYIGLPVNSKLNNPSFYWDLVMINFECCGLKDHTDFQSASLTAKWFELGRNYTVDGEIFIGDSVKIPAACCQFNSTDFIAKNRYTHFQESMSDPRCPLKISGNNTNTVGCYHKILNTLNHYSIILAAVAATIAAVEVLGVICACWLIRAIKEKA